MMIEKVEVKTKATVQDLEEYQAKHVAEDNEEQILRADIPMDGFYRDRIHELSKANTHLREENTKLQKELQDKNLICEEQEKRISKLEKALVEATIK